MTKHLFRKVLAAVALLGIMTSAQAQTPIIISTNTLWDSSTVPTGPIGNVSIASGVTLTVYNCTVEMDTSAVIIVGTNSSLEIVDAQLVPFLTEHFWNGIQFRTSATLIMSNSLIEYAKTGVKHIYGNSLIQIDGSQFYNCAKGLEFDGCAYNSSSQITSTTFDVAPSSFGDFKDNYSNVSFSCHISAENSYVPVIAGCRFLNSNSGINGYNHAINALNSEIVVTCLDGTNSLFRNFHQAILSTDNYTHRLTVRKTDFVGNFTGISAWNVGNTRISCCDFSLGGFDDANYPHREGIAMNICKNYRLHGNTLYMAQGSAITSSTGIYIKNDGGLNGYSSDIYDNKIDELTYGVHATGNNLTLPFPGLTAGLEIYCNRISDCRYGIYNTGLIGEPQGSANASAGNTFNNNGTDIYNHSTTAMTYYYDDSCLPSVYNVTLAHTNCNGCQTVDCSDCALGRMKSGDGPYGLTGDERLEGLARLYYGRDDIESKYNLVEVLKAMGDYEGAEFELRQIGYGYGLTDRERAEYESQSRLFAMEKRMHDEGRGWREMTEDEKVTLKQIALNGSGRTQHAAAAVRNFHGAAAEPGTKQASFGRGDFPLTCARTGFDTTVIAPIYSSELKIVFYNHDICSVSGDTVFVQGRYRIQPNEFPEDAPTSWYYYTYNGWFSFQIHYSDPDLNDFHHGSERCLTDKQCEAINLQITCESDFATGKHAASQCAETVTVVDGHQTFNNTNDTLGFFTVRQLLELDTPYHDHGEGSVTISWTGFDGTPRQHVLYFIIDDHFYIDYVGLEEDDNEHVSASVLGVYPNPTDGMFTIVADDIRTVEVFNQMGQRVLTDRSGSRTINADDLPVGIYFLKVETATATKYGKLMKK